jgi:osmoprotectant transport system permease protein
VIDDLLGFFASPSNREMVLAAFVQHVYLSLLPLVFGGVLALPLGRVAQRVSWLRGFFLGVANVFYTIPSLALFVIIPAVIGTPLLSPINVIVALTIYTIALLMRPVIDALDAVPDPVLDAATAMGFHPGRRFLRAELPLVLPILSAPIRMASVSNISLVSVGALVGIGGLGQLFTDGFERTYVVEIVVGVLLTLLLALVVDLVLVVLWRLLTPWARLEAS